MEKRGARPVSATIGMFLKEDRFLEDAFMHHRTAIAAALLTVGFTLTGERAAAPRARVPEPDKLDEAWLGDPWTGAGALVPDETADAD